MTALLRKSGICKGQTLAEAAKVYQEVCCTKHTTPGCMPLTSIPGCNALTAPLLPTDQLLLLLLSLILNKAAVAHKFLLVLPNFNVVTCH